MKTLVSQNSPHLHLAISHSKRFWTLLAVTLAIILVLLFPRRAFGSEQVIYTLTGGADGSGPTGLVEDEAGNLYGTAFSGGSEQAGTVFELSPPTEPGGTWTETTHYTFLYSQIQNGVGPAAGMVRDGSGNLYGTTWLGGSGAGGVVFKLSPPGQPGGTWTYSVLYDFSAPNDGSSPEAPLTMDAAGNLYGTTVSGGNGGCAGGCGIVFKLARPTHPGGTWTETILYSFPGTFPGNGGTAGGVTLDANGVVYGTTVIFGGGGQGTVFRLTPPKSPHGHWTHQVLYAFAGGTDGYSPSSGVTFDQKGNLYGVTLYGGSGTDCYGGPCGTVYRLTPTSTLPWKHRVIHTFAGGSDGGYPAPPAQVSLDAAGNLFGTTQIGGGLGGATCANHGCGTVYELRPAGGRWKETILHAFAGGADGVAPGGLLLGNGNVLYGEAGAGTDGAGVIFEITPYAFLCIKVWPTLLDQQQFKDVIASGNCGGME